MQDFLRTLLPEWPVKPATDPQFGAEVWRRIAERKKRPSYRLRRWLAGIAGRPTGAALTVALVLFAGFAAGEVWRRHRAQDARLAGLTVYLLAVNPVARAAILPR